MVFENVYGFNLIAHFAFNFRTVLQIHFLKNEYTCTWQEVTSKCQCRHNYKSQSRAHERTRTFVHQTSHDVWKVSVYSGDAGCGILVL